MYKYSKTWLGVHYIDLTITQIKEPAIEVKNVMIPLNNIYIWG